MKQEFIKIIQKIYAFYRSFMSVFYREFALLNIGSVKSKPKVNGFTLFTKNTHLGVASSFNGMKISGGGSVLIGDYFHSGNNCEILTQNHNYEGERIPYDDTYIYNDVKIGDFVWIGNRVMILSGVEIGEGAIIQAGSVVTSNIPDYAIAGGHPAKVFSSRNKDHFLKLKEEKKFH